MAESIEQNGLIKSKYWHNGNFGFMPYPWGVWQPVIPSLYWQAISPEQAQHDLYVYVENLLDYSNRQTQWITELRGLVQKLQETVENFNEDFTEQFTAYYMNTVCEWINNNLDCIVGNAVQFVTVGLSDSGRIALHVPANWEFLQFNMDNNPENENYGALTIDY